MTTPTIRPASWKRTAALLGVLVLLVGAVSPTVLAQQDGEVTVSLEPAQQSTEIDGSVEYDVVVQNADNVGAAEADISLSSPSVATITSITLSGTDASSNPLASAEVGPNGDSASFAVAYGDNALQNDGSGITVATITVEGDAAGETGVQLSGVAVGNAEGASYSGASVNGATFTVSDDSDDGDDQTGDDGDAGDGSDDSDDSDDSSDDSGDQTGDDDQTDGDGSDDGDAGDDSDGSDDQSGEDDADDGSDDADDGSDDQTGDEGSDDESDSDAGDGSDDESDSDAGDGSDDESDSDAGDGSDDESDSDAGDGSDDESDSDAGDGSDDQTGDDDQTDGDADDGQTGDTDDGSDDSDDQTGDDDADAGDGTDDQTDDDGGAEDGSDDTDDGDADDGSDDAEDGSDDSDGDAGDGAEDGSDDQSGDDADQPAAESTYYQVDFAVGEPIEELGPDREGLYSDQSRLVEYLHGSSEDPVTRQGSPPTLDAAYADCVTVESMTVEDGQATATFTVAEGCEYEFSLVSYEKPDEGWSRTAANQQTMVDAETGTYGPGTHTVTVDLPGEEATMWATAPVTLGGPAGLGATAAN